MSYDKSNKLWLLLKICNPDIYCFKGIKELNLQWYYLFSFVLSKILSMSYKFQKYINYCYSFTLYARFEQGTKKI